MQKCVICGSVKAELFTSTYCPNMCDGKPATFVRFDGKPVFLLSRFHSVLPLKKTLVESLYCCFEKDGTNGSDSWVTAKDVMEHAAIEAKQTKRAWVTRNQYSTIKTVVEDFKSNKDRLEAVANHFCKDEFWLVVLKD